MEQSRRDFLKMAGITTISLLLPTTGLSSPERMLKPGPKALTAKRWAMAVIPAKCPSDCKDCIHACHTVHNVPAMDNSKDEIKWIWQSDFVHAFPGENYARMPQSIQQLRLPVLCNQCANPPCVRVCPTKATYQRPDGIVMMDYHRCIGCRFCMAACPYGARSMNYRNPRPFIPKINLDYPTRTRGVVEKCHFCEERLARGLLPACVTACKEKALIFGDLDDPGSDVSLVLRNRLALRRHAILGTQPHVYYLL
ncbi:MAG: sulfate reduction electron transfer complex DsrMKJOP subunit DsrO [Syntrophus sp. SKADARSKE-3]|nr:sulfate reduction electron transfer complex DsrMKJOP subunit DsrO [Syntrophus sp. SKADARSKE-3]